jgi:hypothetical protein
MNSEVGMRKSEKKRKNENAASGPEGSRKGRRKAHGIRRRAQGKGKREPQNIE